MADALTQVPHRRTSVVRGAMLTVSMRWTDRLIGFVSTLILARLLVPDDFGVIAACSLVIGLVEVLSELGVNVALIQNRNATKAHFDTAWTIRLVQGLVTALAIGAVAPLGAAYFDDPRLTLVLQVMSIGIAISAFENIGVIQFQREMRFAEDFRFIFLKRFVRFLITIVAAWFLRNYWALVIATLAGRGFAVGLSYAMHPMRPRWCLQKWREIFGVSQWMLVRSVGLYLNGGLHRIIVGGRADASVLGGYTLASEISAMPATEVLSPLNRVLFPAFVNVKHDLAELKRMFLLAQGVQTLFAIPASVGLALVASELVPLLLGEKWGFVVPFVQLLALSSVVQAIATSGNYVLITVGRIAQVAALTWIQVAVFAAVVFLAMPDGQALEIAEARVATVVFGLGVSIWFLRQALPEVRLRDIWGTSGRPILATAVMGAAVWGTGSLVGDFSSVVVLLAKISAGVVVYPAVVLLLWAMAGKPAGAESYVSGLLAKRAFRRR